MRILGRVAFNEGHTDEMIPNPPRIPVFYTLAKIHKPKPVGRLIIGSLSKHDVDGSEKVI